MQPCRGMGHRPHAGGGHGLHPAGGRHGRRYRHGRGHRRHQHRHSAGHGAIRIPPHAGHRQPPPITPCPRARSPCPPTSTTPLSHAPISSSGRRTRSGIPTPQVLAEVQTPEIAPGGTATVAIDVNADNAVLTSIAEWGPKPLRVDFHTDGTSVETHTFLTRSTEGLNGAATPGAERHRGPAAVQHPSGRSTRMT